MAFAADNRCEYHIRQLDTRSVTLFPSRAQVVREVKSVPLKIGTNKIVFIGLTHHLDKESVKIEGVGAGTISDMTVVSEPNRESFDDVYPEPSPEGSDTTFINDQEESKSDPPSPELQAVRNQLSKLRIEQEYATELTNSAVRRLGFLDSYLSSLTQAPTKYGETIDIQKAVDAYKEERVKVFEDTMDGKNTLRKLQKRINELTNEELRLSTLAQRKIAKENIDKQKRNSERRYKKKKQEQFEDRARVRREQEAFWPKNVYVVTVNIEVGETTPASSPRDSLSGHLDAQTASSYLEALICDLTLSYVTSQAHWQPSYDLSLSTTTNTGTLYFNALLTNQTTETWSNCNVILSTSQTTFTSLHDAVPSLRPWRVGLSKGFASEEGDILFSSKGQDGGGNLPSRDVQQLQATYDNPHIPLVAEHFRSTQLRKRVAQAPAPSFRSSAYPSTPGPRPNPMPFQEPSFEDSGLKLKYDLPGPKRLTPSNNASKQRVARLTFADVVFNHKVVPKRNAAVYLQAQLQNASKLTLLKGAVSLTLDGEFLGRSTLDRCAPGSSLKLSLGVDHAIQVDYPKPEVQHGLGMFSKDNTTVYTQHLTLQNTRSEADSKAVRVTALDQVPESGDKRLHVAILQPQGLAPGGSAVYIAESQAWGKAEATMEEGGQIEWDVTINAGHTAELVLQYQCVFPTGEKPVNV
ncbi:hypothetical protein GGR52DRAFT_572902 [Hypoxylon sp. FL1284]|nr:hypothetical protein GGR52DRAFT_572902 [Hypoxylon sp. FL1284]